MTDAESLGAIFDRLGKIDRDLVAHSTRMEGEMVRIADKLADLDERVRVQNSRVTKAEHRLHELETQARIAHEHAEDDKASRDWWKEKSAAVVIGSMIATIAALLGYIL